MDIVEQLLSKIKVTKDGCFEWQGKLSREGNGYGVGVRKCGQRLAHRASFEAFRGPIPNRMCVCHHCDNPRCINPAHLFLGTHLENIRDAAMKGRMRRGLENHFTKLTPEKVAQIKRMLIDGKSKRSIAKLFGVSRQAVLDIQTEHTWRYVTVA